MQNKNFKKYRHFIMFAPTLVLAAIIIAGIYVEANFLARQVQENTKEDLQQTLQVVKQVILIEEEQAFIGDGASSRLSYDQQAKSLDEFLRRIAFSTEHRITLIDESGIVEHDSKLPLSLVPEMDNHASRPEVQMAVTQGVGSDIRFSETTGQNYIYLANRVEIPEELQKFHIFHDSAYIVIRASMPIENLQQLIVESLSWVILSGVVILVIVMISSVLSLFAMKKFVERDKEELAAHVESQTKELRILQHMGSLLGACSSMDDAAEVIRAIGIQLIPNAKSGAISLIKSSRNQLNNLVEWGEPWPGHKNFSPNDCWALLQGHVHHSQSAEVDVRCRHYHSDEEIYFFCHPLMAQGETLGVLHLVFEQESEILLSESNAATFAEQIGLSLANIQLRDDLQYQASRDPLTDLYNRAFLLDQLAKTLGSAMHDKGEFVVMMLDGDHFKLFNDKFGHDAGDFVLKQLARLFNEVIGDEGIVCRYGGEEFSILCPLATYAEGSQLAEDVRKRIADENFIYRGQSLGSVTVSIGVSGYPQDGRSADALLKAADNALYSSKEAGRNRVSLATPLQDIESSIESSAPLPLYPSVTSHDKEKEHTA
ncbi:sensor domain-containing diguanylate cyclase [Thaumasiovibrio subtropicus]|uniref:sensor domain-containing diguanylate cyclase n=1 Tax=Thaumasiovibrio subtropicus TaxID=1891207 RepID=UPI000B359FDF|nr:sensor domain-containing diguanylate cyclase [Thaumasiovibrio subtropicus]